MSASTYYFGTVDWCDDRSGRGYILPDEDDKVGSRLQFHRSSLRTPATVLRAGDRVLFRLEETDRGLQAADIHTGLDPDDRASTAETATGVVSRIVDERGFGFIDVYDGRDAFFHISSLVGTESLPPVGTTVSCELIQTEKGLQAQNVVCTSEPDNSPSIATTHDSEPTSVSVAKAACGRVAHSPQYDRGFGFVELDDDERAFFHVSQLVDPTRLPLEGEAVVCRVAKGSKGPQAFDVATVSDASLALNQAYLF